ncbi:MAG TPA: DinB family protein [Candidatus Acidoferrales bacterium]|nr:DinB family protein [Candidatus Acidoferrales bacterium]
MKRFLVCAIVAVFVACFAPLVARAQSASNPVSDTVKKVVEQRTKIIVAAAEEMPAEKYSFRPTPQQMTFGHLIMHLAQSNNFLCAAIAGTKPPEQANLSDTDPKDTLVSALKSSFEYCSGVLDKTDDSKLAEMLPMRHGSTSRASVMITLTDDLFDHYSAEAMYLRLSGLLPPTAQRQPMK